MVDRKCEILGAKQLIPELAQRLDSESEAKIFVYTLRLSQTLEPKKLEDMRSKLEQSSHE
ncbi:MAG TPA: hypothetical protein VEH06_13360 [Candidatus Bathyarchaeia archaeon]|nr:hypothetical protein [Candidatus Bathyarchaeia archaeon]